MKRFCTAFNTLRLRKGSIMYLVKFESPPQGRELRSRSSNFVVETSSAERAVDMVWRRYDGKSFQSMYSKDKTTVCDIGNVYELPF